MTTAKELAERFGWDKPEEKAVEKTAGKPVKEPKKK
jgi:hypothetical protein